MPTKRAEEIVSYETVDTLLPYYVYELRDPRNNELFYVGKGTRDRLNMHDEPDKDADGTAKESRIAEIRAAGFKDCIRLIVGRYRTELEAFAVEATLIKWIYGRDNLTNRVAGHRDRFIRSRTQRENWPASQEEHYPSVPLIDEQKRQSGIRDGQYTQRQIQAAIDNAVEEKLWAVRDFIVPRIAKPGLTLSDPLMFRPQDPHLLISGLSSAARIVLKLQLTGERITVTACPNGDKKAFKALIADVLPDATVANGSLYNGAHLHLHNFLAERRETPEISGRYGVPIERLGDIHDLLVDAIDLLSDGR